MGAFSEGKRKAIRGRFSHACVTHMWHARLPWDFALFAFTTFTERLHKPVFSVPPTIAGTHDGREKKTEIFGGIALNC